MIHATSENDHDPHVGVTIFVNMWLTENAELHVILILVWMYDVCMLLVFRRLYCNNTTMNHEHNVKHQHQHQYQHWSKRNHYLDLNHHHEAQALSTRLIMNDKRHLKTTKYQEVMMLQRNTFSYVCMPHANVCFKLTTQNTDHRHPHCYSNVVFVKIIVFERLHWQFYITT